MLAKLFQASEYTDKSCPVPDSKSKVKPLETFNPESIGAVPEIVSSPEAHQPSPDCGSCDSHHFGWCRAVPGKLFYNIRLLRACPLENSQCEALLLD